MLFKIESKIHTLKETIDFTKKINTYNCMVDGSIMLRDIGLTSKMNSSFSSKMEGLLKSEKKIEITSHVDILRKYIDVHKINNFINSQNIKVPSEVYVQMKKLGVLNKCIKPDEEIEPIYKDFMKMEIYFKSRFYTQNFLVSKSDLEKDYNQTFPTEESRKNHIISLKRQNAVSTFVKSLENQISHEENW